MPMYNLLEYSSNYFNRASSLWFYCKDNASHFSNGIVNSNDFKSFKYKAKLLKNTSADLANIVSKEATIDEVYLINFDQKQSKGTHWVSLFIDKNAAAYLGFFVTEYISQEVLSKIKDKSITRNIRRIEDVLFHCVKILQYRYHRMIAGRLL